MDRDSQDEMENKHTLSTIKAIQEQTKLNHKLHKTNDMK